MTVLENFPLKDTLYYKIGGKAKYILKVQSRGDLLEALEFIKKNNIKKTLLVGLGANLLVSDNFFDGAVLHFVKPIESSIRQDSNGLVSAFASETLKNLIQFCFKNNLRGLEWAGGLPSTVGAGIRGNVGAFGSEIKDVVDRVETIDLNNGETKVLTKGELQFSYRNSLIKQSKNLIVITAYFKLEKTDEKGTEEAKKIYTENINYRKEHHPLGFASCGSVFKNIVEKEKVEKIISKWPDIKDLVFEKWYGKISMGYLISKLGFSNFTVGGAKVSEKQANFIVNFNNAKFDDVISIIAKIKEKFFQEFGFYPELEVEIIR